MMNEKKTGYSYALDIGTRTVMGVLSVADGDSLIIKDIEVLSHPDRSMYDGQVHDIEKVTAIIKKVTQTLEERNEIKIERASIAAAGRSLKTEKVVVVKNLDNAEEIDLELLDLLEMQAIQEAQSRLKARVSVAKTLYYCVGSSVSGIYLDGISVKNPVGHSAAEIKYGLVATFLPHNVSDTLYKVVEGSGLEIDSMTLEPIAAIELAIDSKLRLLNLALVDIGAGTSDIALTKDGEIFSYAMADLAGDEITESLMRAYLLDFDEAENLKISLDKGGTHEFTNVVGKVFKMDTKDIIFGISEQLNSIASTIVNEIVAANQKPPSAVFLVGGSSQLPTLKERIAHYLGIDADKVVVGKTSRIKKLSFDLKEKEKLDMAEFDSPEYVTPFGIAYSSHFVKKRDFIGVRINGRVYRLFNRDRLSIADALVLAGFSAKRLIQTRGKSLSFTLNGEKRVISGGAGEPSKILLNAVVSSLNAAIKHMDVIEITKPIRGEDASVNLEDVVDYRAYVLKEGVRLPLISAVYVNNKPMDKSYSIKNGDEIVSVNRGESNLREDIKSYDAKYKDEDYKPANDADVQTAGGGKDIRPEDFSLVINGRVLNLPNVSAEFTAQDLFDTLNFNTSALGEGKGLFINGNRANLSAELNNGDRVDVKIL